MASRIIGRDTYDALLEAFREDPDNVSAAAKAAGCSWGMAKRAFDRGWPERFTWARPIREHVEDVQRRARAERYTMVAVSQGVESSAADDAAKLDAARAHALEGLAVEACLAATGNLATGLADITHATRPLIQKLLRKLRELGGDEDAEVDIEGSIKMLGALAFQLRQLNSALHEVQKSERLHLGEPGEIIGHVDMSDEARRETIARAERAVEMARRADERLRVIQGGNG